MAVITGASSGIGREAAVELARRGWLVAVAGRDPDRTQAVAQATGGTAHIADFDDLAQVRAVAEEIANRYPNIHALVNNAGGILARRQVSADGHELTLQRNVLASIVLTERLKHSVQASGGRVIHTSSVIHRVARLRLDDLDWAKRRYGVGWRAYAESKLGVLLYARHLARTDGLESYPFHPGYVQTGFGPDARSAQLVLRATRGLQISAAAGAAPLVHLVDTPELGVESGTYFDGLTPMGPEHPLARDGDTISSYVQECLARVG